MDRVDSRWGRPYGGAVSTPSDPQREQSDDGTDETRQAQADGPTSAERPGQTGEDVDRGDHGQSGDPGSRPRTASRRAQRVSRVQPGEYGQPGDQASRVRTVSRPRTDNPRPPDSPASTARHPQYGQTPQYGQNPQYGQYPQYGSPAPYGAPAQYGAPSPYAQPGQDAPYGQPGQYGSGQPGAYGPYGQQPGPYVPYGSQYGQYAYTPYGTPYPAGLDDGGLEPAARPRIMVLSLVLLILSALPFLAFGAVLLLLPIDANTIPQVDIQGQLAEAGITIETLVSVLRVFGAIALVLALLYVTFAVLAFLGRNWARIVLTIMTAGFALLLLAGVAGGGASDPSSLTFLLLVLAAAVGGTVILFLPDANRFFAGPRR